MADLESHLNTKSQPKSRLFREKKLAANRANAKKSTGPRSAIGRKGSSSNASGTAALAATIVLSCESHECFQELLAGLNQELKPVGIVESSLIGTMAAARRRLLPALGH